MNSGNANMTGKVGAFLRAGFCFIWLAAWGFPGFAASLADPPADMGRIKFQRISLDDGLSQSIVECIFQDQAGYMWFGSEDGLNKYDGYRFTIYRQSGRNEIGLSHNNILALYESRDGVLWIGTFQSGLHSYNPKTGEKRHFTVENGAGKGLSNNLVREIVGAPNGVVWLATQDGLNKLEQRDNRFSFSVYRHNPDDPSSIGSNVINSLWIDADNSLWVGTPSGLFRLAPDSNRFDPFPGTPDDPSGLRRANIQCIFRDRSGVLWLGADDGLYCWDPLLRRPSVYRRDPNNAASLNDNTVTALFEDSAGVLWVGTKSGGLHILDRRTGCFSHFTASENPTSISHNGIRSIYEDRSGVIWIGTYGGGLSKFARQKVQFSHFWADPANQRCGLSHNIVWSICEDREGVLWVGTHGGGLNRLDRPSGCFTQYRSDPARAGAISSDFVRYVYEDPENVLWVGTEKDGLNRFHRESNRFTVYRAKAGDPTAIGSNSVLYIFRDRGGTLWVGSAGEGLSAMNPQTGVFTSYRADASHKGALSNDYIRVVYEDRSGALWVGTQGGGLNLFHRDAGTFSQFRHIPGDDSSLSHDYVFTLLEDHRGFFWVGVWGGGLNRFDRKTGKFTHYGVADGLPSDAVYGMLEDEKTGDLWLSTNNGLCRVSLDGSGRPSFRNFSEENGLQSREFNGGAYHQSTRSGEMFFGGINGFNSFFPSAIRENRRIPPVVITAFYKMNREIVMSRPANELDEIILAPGEYNFAFEFAALDYTAPRNNLHRYMLEGVDPEWIDAGPERRFASYTNLKPGEYIFRAIGSNNDGYWNETGAAIKIIVEPMLHQTWFFKGFLAMALIVILIVIHRRRTRFIRANMEKLRLQKELNLKADFTAMLVHDLRSPLTAIMGYAQMLKAHPEHANPAKIGHVITQSSGKMLELINDMLDFSKFEAGKMGIRLRLIIFSSLVREVMDLMRPLFDQKSQTLSCEIAPEAVFLQLSIDNNRMEQVLANLLSNASKYTPRGGRVMLRLSLWEGEMAEFSVTDTGPGVGVELQGFLFDKYAQLSQDVRIKGTGLGLAVSRLIVEAHGGYIGYRPGPGNTGACFYFRLPIPAQSGSAESATKETIAFAPSVPPKTV